MERRKISLLATTFALVALACSQGNSGDKKAKGLLALLALSSSSNSSSSGLKTAPTANADYDNSAQGIYTGTITGSSGSWSIDYDNNGTGAAPVFKFSYTPDSGAAFSDSVTGTATGTNPVTLTFSKTYSGTSVVLSFEVSSTGVINSATLSIGGVTHTVTAVKEKSTALSRAFEGTFSGSYTPAIMGGSTITFSGVFNAATEGEATLKSASLVKLVNGSACTTGCAGTMTATLDATTKKLNATGAQESNCFSGGATTGTCNCQRTSTSNGAFSLSDYSNSGTLSVVLVNTSSCNINGLGVRADGYVVATGTWSATRTQ